MSDRKGELLYSCPSCAAPLAFDPTLGKLTCEFCGSEYTPEEIEELNKRKEADKEAQRTEEEWKEYSCSSCGAQLLADQNTAVMQCPYCGNHTIVTAQFAGTIRPDSLIPFGITREAAMEQYNDYYRKGVKKFLLPKSFGRDNHIEEIQGVYIPFWLFQGKAEIDGIYEASNSHRDGDYRIVEHYRAERSGSMEFSHVPADASKRMADDLMDSIEPYDFQALRPFAMSYLPGFLAERFDVEEADNRRRAGKRVEETIARRTRETLHYERIDDDRGVDIRVSFKKTDYALLPAWLLTTRWGEREWTFAMNGQTGKFTGNLPISGGKLALLIVLAFLIGFFPPLLLFDTGTAMALFAGTVVALFTGLYLHGVMKPVANAHNADPYMGEAVNLSRKRDYFVDKERIYEPRKKDD